MSNFFLFVFLTHFMISALAFTVTNDDQVKVTPNLLNDKDIKQYLIETEDLRTTNFPKFSENLRIISTINDNISGSNQCYYEYLLAYQSSYIGNFEQANNKLKKISVKCSDQNLKIRIKLLLANLNVLSGKYQQAINNLDNVISQVESVDDKITKHMAYTAAFIIYDIVDQEKLSLKFAELLIQDKPIGKILCKARTYKYLSLLKENQGFEVDTDVLDTIKHCQKEGDNVYAQILNLAWIKTQFHNTNDRDRITRLYNSLAAVEGEIEETKYKFIIIVKNSVFAQIHEKLGNEDQAINYAHLVVKDSVSIGTTEQKINALQVLINFHQKKLDYESANKYLIEKNRAEKKLYSDTQAKLMAYQTVKHDSLAKTLQIESLNQKNKLLELGKELAQKSKTNQRLLNALFAAFILFLFYMGFRIKRKQQQYKRLSELDHMTLIYNRKGVRDYMDYLLPYAQNKNEIVAYGIFDLDLFKTINDKYGHNTGDWVIKTVVDSCKKLDNNKVTFARLGGEEFAIIIRDSSINEMIQFSEQCRQAINSIVTEEGTGFVFEISASFGITTTELSGFDYSDLMQNADKALYAAKNKGRNQVSIYQQT